MPELGCTSAVQNEKNTFFILYCWCRVSGTTLERNAAGAPSRRSNTNGVRYPKLAILFVVFMYLQVKASSLDFANTDMRTRRPKIACVQDIRPHVPELGCTSAVQNEKNTFFIFVLLSAANSGVCLCLEPESCRGAPVPRRLANWGSIPQSWQYFIRGIHVFASQGIEP